MGEALRGPSSGAVSYENDRGIQLAPRLATSYRCASGHLTEVPVQRRGRHPCAVGVPHLRRLRAAGRRRTARAGRGPQAAHALGHARGAALGRRPRGSARGAADAAPRSRWRLACCPHRLPHVQGEQAAGRRAPRSRRPASPPELTHHDGPAAEPHPPRGSCGGAVTAVRAPAGAIVRLLRRAMARRVRRRSVRRLRRSDLAVEHLARHDLLDRDGRGRARRAPADPPAARRRTRLVR